MNPDFNPELDLLLERVVDVPRALVWEAWTTPKHLIHWFVPKPWTVTHCEIDLRPGGIFSTIMRSPEGQEFPNTGCYLEVVPMERFTWTDVLLKGFRPANTQTQGVQMTATIYLTDEGAGTKYTAFVQHPDENSRKRHEEMGFYDGWGTVVTQMEAYAKEYMQK